MNTLDGSFAPSDGAGISAAAGAGGSDDPRVIEVVEDYLTQLELGMRPDRAAYLRRYPELADAVACCLDGLSFVRDALPAEVVCTNGGAAPFPESNPECQPGPLGDFQIVKELGRGGMGVVYEAVQISLGRRVALKVLPFASTFEARQLQRFKNEAQAAALLHHQHIVAVHAVGCERGVHFYAMQLIEGQSLAIIIHHWREQSESLAGDINGAGSEIDGRGNIAVGSSAGVPSMIGRRRDRREFGKESGADAVHNSTANVSAALTDGASLSSPGYFRRVARLTIQAADALEHAHRLGVVHRDVKPANLLVNTAGDLWVTDFGLAQFHADTGLTRSGDLLGTFRYMSPEQTSGHRVVLDHRTDIYSLGATLYELLTLEPVFGGETRQELVYQILHQEPRSPRLVNRAVPVELETIVSKALAKNPAERYGTAAEFASDLQRFLDHQPIHARRPSIFDRARKWSRRHPTVVVAAVLLLFVVAVALSISNRLISREQEKTVAALEQVSQEQQRTATALENERIRANEAEARFQQARHTADMLVQLNETVMDKRGFSPQFRLRLLTIALENYQGLVAQVDDDRPELAAARERTRHAIRHVTLLHEEIRVLGLQVWMHLLWSPAVLDDLGLTGGERKRAAELRQQWLEDWSVAIEQTRNRDEHTRRARYLELATAHEEQFAKIFTLERGERLGEITAQAVSFSVTNPSSIEHLGFPTDVPTAVAVLGAEGGPLAVGAGGVSERRLADAGDMQRPSIHEGAVALFAALAKAWHGAVGRPFAVLYGSGTSPDLEIIREPGLVRPTK